MRFMLNKFIVVSALFAFGIHCGSAAAQDRGDAFDEIPGLVAQAIGKGDLPGAVVCFADSRGVRYLQSFGDRQVLPESIAMTADTVFDLASITKPVSTATSVAMLCQQGVVDVDDVVVKYLPEFAGHDKELITVRQCLLHTSGLTPDNALSDYNDGSKIAWERICGLKLRSPPGEKFAYSDVGFIVLGKLVERVGGKPLDVFAKENVFIPFGMNETTYNPGQELRVRAAPTEKQGDDWVCGRVHDPRAARLDGVAGHAGLFSTAADLVRYGQEMLAAAAGKSEVMTKQTFDRMTSPNVVPRGTRTLGFDHRSPYSSNRGDSLSDGAFGHGGFTGTVLWIDPQKDLIFVFLSSRLHPDGKGSVNALAGKIVTAVAAGWD